MNTMINIRTDKSIRNEAKKIFLKMRISTSAGQIRVRWDAQTAKALKAKKYSSANSALRGL
jgi:hypothetical protein